MKNMRAKIKEVFARRSCLLMDMKDLVDLLNRKIVGLRNYYALKYAGRKLNTIDWYIKERLITWYNLKHQKRLRYRGYRKIVPLLNSAGLKGLAKHRLIMH